MTDTAQPYRFAESGSCNTCGMPYRYPVTGCDEHDAFERVKAQLLADAANLRDHDDERSRA